MNEIVTTTGQDILPMDLMQRAVSSGADIIVLEKLMGLQERHEANKARRAFDEAIAAFKGDVPVIVKDKLVDFTSNRGRTRYKHADLSSIASAVDKPLAKVGLSYRWRTVSTSPTSVTVTCVVSHRDGYSEENSLSGGPDPTGTKNSIQALGSTVTYLQRYTLMSALGLTATEDDDGAGAKDDPAANKANRSFLEAAAAERKATEPPETAPYRIGRDTPDEAGWIKWANTLKGHVEAAREHSIDEWLVINGGNLDELETFNPTYHERMMSIINDAVAART